MWMMITCLAVASWCAMSYMLPIVWAIVWWRRHRDKTEIIQEDDWPDIENWPDDE
jgi:hypothetical protein